MPSDNYTRHISQQADSGLSILAYCRKFSLTYHTFLYRKKRLESHAHTSPSAFAEVTSMDSLAASHADIILGHAHIHIPLCASLEQWKTILQACAGAFPC